MSRERITPVFVLSLPRSGSTLLQRILGAHQAICTTSEPWLLLPALYARRPSGAYAEYGHSLAVAAIDDFVRSLPAGAQAYRAAVREFALRLYSQAATEDALYFVDKTPRYHLIVEEILDLFPDSRFVFLWRNPLAVAASMITTWGRGRWNLHRYKIDLYDGLERLLTAHKRHREKVMAVRYEDLVTRPYLTCQDIFRYLQLHYEPAVLTNFSFVELSGRMGDPSGTRRYQHLSSEPLDKWNSVFCNPLRKRWGLHYLKWIGPSRLSDMGYDFTALTRQLHRLPVGVRYLPSDIARRGYGVVHQLAELGILRDKMSRLPHWVRIHEHL